MIVRDEEDVLARCLDGVTGFADEIIIVDTGSTDKTHEIAARYTDKLYSFAWCDDFAAARNFSFSFATCDYIMVLDADDVITPENAEKVSELKRELALLDNRPACILAEYDVPENGFRTLHPRMVKRSANPQWENPLHERLRVSGDTVTSDFCVLHRKLKPPTSTRNAAIIRKMLNDGFEWDFQTALSAWLDACLAKDEELLMEMRAICEQIANRLINRPLTSSENDLTFVFMFGDIVKGYSDFENAAWAYSLAAKEDRNYEIKYRALLKLAECAVALGDYDAAAVYNETAGRIIPESVAVKLNKIFLGVKQRMNGK
jgi:glycosyltransferase involved in cell wall biosynthesis